MAGAAQQTLPLRPLTVGEVLDAASALLRRYAARLLPISAALAVAEQAVLLPVRLAARSVPPDYGPYAHDFGAYWLLVSTGLGTETVIVTILAGLAARAAVPLLLDRPASTRPSARLVPLTLLALLLGTVAGLGAVAGWLPWLVWYLFTGLAAPALLIDRAAHVATVDRAASNVHRAGRLELRPVPLLAALGRSFVLVGSGGLRAGWIRLLGLLAWVLIRLALGLATLALFVTVAPLASTVFQSLTCMAAFALVNTIAYAALGCLDVVLHVETRIRVEGLDIAMSRARHRGLPTGPVLVVPHRLAARR